MESKTKKQLNVIFNELMSMGLTFPLEYFDKERYYLYSKIAKIEAKLALIFERLNSGK